MREEGVAELPLNDLSVELKAQVLAKDEQMEELQEKLQVAEECAFSAVPA